MKKKIVDYFKGLVSKIGFNEHTFVVAAMTTMMIFSGSVICDTIFRGGASTVSVFCLAGWVFTVCGYTLLVNDDETDKPKD